MKKYALILVKLSIACLCFAVISTKIDMAALRRTVSHVRLEYLMAAFVLTLITRLIMACKWDMLLRYSGVRIGFYTALKIIWISNFVGMLSPTSLGVDAFRAYMVKKQKHSLALSIGSIITDRVLAIGSLISLAAIGCVIILPSFEEKKVLYQILAMCLVFGLGAGVIISPLVLTVFTRVVKTVQSLCVSTVFRSSDTQQETAARLADKAVHKASSLHKAMVSFTKSGRVVSVVFLLNVLVQVCRIGQVHFLFRGMGTEVSVVYEAAFVPIIMLLTMLPISLFGLGVKEMAYVYFFTTVHVTPEQALSVSFLTYLLLLVSIIPGAVFFFFGYPRKDSGLERT